jgi:hypothetical protein
VLNFGVPGFNTKDEIEFFKVVGLKYNPDIVIIAYVCNDVEDNFELDYIAKNITEKYFNNRNLTDEQKIQVALEAWKTMHEMVQKNYDYYFNKIVKQPLKELLNLSLSKGIKIYLVYFECEFPYRGEKDRLLELLNETKNISFIDGSIVFKIKERKEITTPPPDLMDILMNWEIDYLPEQSLKNSWKIKIFHIKFVLLQQLALQNE